MFLAPTVREDYFPLQEPKPKKCTENTRDLKENMRPEKVEMLKAAGNNGKTAGRRRREDQSLLTCPLRGRNSGQSFWMNKTPKNWKARRAHHDDRHTESDLLKA